MKSKWKIDFRKKENHGLRPVHVCSIMPNSLWPMDCSLSSSSVPSIFRAGIIEWIAISYTRRSFSPEIKPEPFASPALAGGFFTTEGKSKMKVKVSQSCLTLCGPMAYSSWNSPGQNTGVGSLFLLQGIFLTKGSNSGLLHCRWILYQLSHNYHWATWESPIRIIHLDRKALIKLQQRWRPCRGLKKPCYRSEKNERREGKQSRILLMNACHWTGHCLTTHHFLSCETVTCGPLAHFLPSLQNVLHGWLSHSSLVFLPQFRMI